MRARSVVRILVRGKLTKPNAIFFTDSSWLSIESEKEKTIGAYVRFGNRLHRREISEIPAHVVTAAKPMGAHGASKLRAKPESNGMYSER